VPRRRKHWGWGFEDEQPGGAELRDAATGLAAHLGFGAPEPAMPAPVALPAPRLDVPSGWATDDHARALAAHGASYLDVVRAFRGEFPHPPGAEAVRAIVRAGMQPANLRLVDAREAALTFAGDGASALLVLGFEDVVEPFDAAAALCRAHGGEVRESGGGSGAWREAFLRAPYVRDVLVAMGVLSETFETAITWERLPGFVETVLGAAREAVGEPAIVTCRLTHAYTDGAAPYFTVLAPARAGDEEAQWTAVKAAATAAILTGGGTVTHHHAVGREHRDAWAAQRPDPFATVLRAARTTLDPAGTLNPGVLFET
jgi:alkyldihydroxyacetonephosphate synthase